MKPDKVLHETVELLQQRAGALPVTRRIFAKVGESFHSVQPPPSPKEPGTTGLSLSQALARAQALGCKRVEILLPEPRDDRHAFFESYGFVNNANDLWVKART